MCRTKVGIDPLYLKLSGTTSIKTFESLSTMTCGMHHTLQSFEHSILIISRQSYEKRPPHPTYSPLSLQAPSLGGGVNSFLKDFPEI